MKFSLVFEKNNQEEERFESISLVFFLPHLDQPWLTPNFLSTSSPWRFSGLVFVWTQLETNQGCGSFMVKLQTSFKGRSPRYMMLCTLGFWFLIPFDEIS